MSHLPPGDLADLLADPALQQMLDNGAMFPDGGYPLGDGYSEIAHWEPFQNLYRDHIATDCQAPWTDICAQQIAFLMGMASHSMADQVYDSLYYERGLQRDPDSSFDDHSFDQATDVAFMAVVGRVDFPDDWVPTDTLVGIYQDYGYTVSADTLADGQNLLRIGVLWVGNASEDPDLLASESAWFPWLTSHLDDDSIPGNPPCEADVVAAYMQSVYRRLQGDLSLSPELLATFPRGGFGLETDRTKVESRISAVFSQAIDDSTLTEGLIEVTDPQGAVVPTRSWFYYGDHSTVLHIAPEQDWAADTAYTVHVGAGLTTLDSQQTSGDTRFEVSTATAPAAQADPDPTVDNSGCSSLPGRMPGGPLGGIALVGALVGVLLRRRAQPTSGSGAGGSSRPKRQGRSSGRKASSAL